VPESQQWPAGWARQLASRARRRVQGAASVPDADLATQRAVVDAFLAAREVRGAAAVANQAFTYSRLGLLVQPALVNGTAGVVSTRDGEPFSFGGFTVRGGKIVEIDILADPDPLAQLDLTMLD
jgi:hypothetical protein